MKQITKLLIFIFLILSFHSNIKPMQQEEPCVICSLNYNDSENKKVEMICCKNILCKKCIDAWITSCPFCRKKVLNIK